MQSDQSEFLLKELRTLKYSSEGIKPSVVAELTKSISHVGLLHPIVINTNNRIVSGRHRLLALLELGVKDAEVRVINFKTRSKRDLATIEENLTRTSYTYLERARQYKAQKVLLEKLNLVTVHGGDKRKRQNSPLVSAASKIASVNNESERTVRDLIHLSEKIPSSLDKLIRGTPLENSRSKLIKLSNMKTLDEQKAVIKKKDVKKPEPPKLDDQLARLDKLVQRAINHLGTIKVIPASVSHNSWTKVACEGPRIARKISKLSEKYNELNQQFSYGDKS